MWPEASVTSLVTMSEVTSVKSWMNKARQSEFLHSFFTWHVGRMTRISSWPWFQQSTFSGGRGPTTASTASAPGPSRRPRALSLKSLTWDHSISITFNLWTSFYWEMWKRRDNFSTLASLSASWRLDSLSASSAAALASSLRTWESWIHWNFRCWSKNRILVGRIHTLSMLSWFLTCHCFFGRIINLPDILLPVFFSLAKLKFWKHDHFKDL